MVSFYKGEMRFMDEALCIRVSRVEERYDIVMNSHGHILPVNFMRQDMKDLHWLIKNPIYQNLDAMELYKDLHVIVERMNRMLFHMVYMTDWTKHQMSEENLKQCKKIIGSLLVLEEMEASSSELQQDEPSVEIPRR